MDRIFVKEPEAWTKEDLDALVAAKVPEGMRLEYKEAMPLSSPSQKAEVAKDVSGLANAQGGWLFFGIAEDESDDPLPFAIVPLQGEGIQTQLENILDTTLEPKAEFQAATVRRDEGAVIVMRVEPRRGHPIMVQGYSQYRYFRRNGTRTVPMTATEVSEAFAAAKGRDQELFEALQGLPLKTRVTRRRSADELDLSLKGIKKPIWLPLATVLVAAIDCSRPLFTPEMLSREAFPEDREGYMRSGLATVRPRGAWTLDAFGLHEEVAWELDPEYPPGWLAARVAIFRQGVFEWAHRYRQGSEQ
ncbi:MAG TPA: ATP-binding protein, partial [Candidatus Dormibacteraeota bacterium]